MKTTFILFLSLSCCLAFANNSVIPKVDDSYVVKKEITFLKTDYTGMANIADLFQEKIQLKTGFAFKVTQERSLCETETHQGKRIKHCASKIILESDSCGIENTEMLEQKISYDSAMFRLIVVNGHCKIHVEDKIYETIFSGVSKEILAKKSVLNKYFLKLR